MVKTSKRAPGRPKPSTEMKSVKITLNFSAEQIDIIDRAAAKEDDNRANWIRRRALHDARAELGIVQPDPGKK
jgi:uncharacterized protein (DUF1778 family)